MLSGFEDKTHVLNWQQKCTKKETISHNANRLHGYIGRNRFESQTHSRLWMRIVGISVFSKGRVARRSEEISEHEIKECVVLSFPAQEIFLVHSFDWGKGGRFPPLNSFHGVVVRDRIPD
jgi:hypothetical protein